MSTGSRQAEGLHHGRADRLRHSTGSRIRGPSESLSFSIFRTRPSIPTSLPRSVTREAWTKLRSSVRTARANTFENYRGKPRWLRDQRNSWHGVDFPYHSALDVERYYKRYSEALSAVDDSIGTGHGQLGEMGVLDETLVIYMGDNGFMLGSMDSSTSVVAVRDLDPRSDVDALPRTVLWRNCGRAGGR